MSEDKARSWLSSHHDIIPALEIHHRNALAALADHDKTVRDLADIIALDPGMSVSLYHEVNLNRQNTGSHSIDSVHGALALLGDSAIADLVMQHKVISETHPDAARRQSYHQLVSRSYLLLAQLDSFVAIQGIKSVNEIRSAALLHNIGEYCACLFDHGRYQQYQKQFHRSGAETNAAKAVFGFDFYEVGRLYAAKSGLPALVSESLDEKVPHGRRARLIQLAADISHQAEIGWYHSAMKATEEICAAYLNQSLDGFDKKLQQVAIEAARACPFDDVLPAAARLIMLPDREAPAPAHPIHPAEPAVNDASASDFEIRIKSLLNSPRATQAHLLDLLLTHLHDDLHLSRVVLLLLSSDKTKLGTRASRGLVPDSPIRTLVIDIDKPSLPHTLLAKPQAIWIDTAGYREYEAALPKKFKSGFLHENFFLMSLFVGDKPIGIVFGDRALTVTALDKSTYINFKSAIKLVSKALGVVARGRRGNAS